MRDKRTPKDVCGEASCGRVLFSESREDAHLTCLFVSAVFFYLVEVIKILSLQLYSLVRHLRRKLRCFAAIF